MRVHNLKVNDNQYIEYLPDSMKILNANEKSNRIINEIVRGADEKQLHEKGFEISTEEYIRTRSLLEENITKKMPERTKGHLDELIVHISNDCNLACVYCYADGGTYHSERCLMKPEVLKETLDKFYLIYPDIDVLQLFGGEPMLNPKLIRMTCEYVKEHNKKSIVGMVSNGTIVTDELIELIKEYGFKITYSVDIEEMQNLLRPARGGKKTYQTIINNFNRLRSETSEPSGIEVTYTGKHQEAGFSVADTIKRLREVFGDVSMLFNSVSTDNEKLKVKGNTTFLDAIDELYQSNNKLLYYGSSFVFNMVDRLNKRTPLFHSCNCGYGTFGVSSKGDVFACQSFVGCDDYKFGNVFDPIEELEKS